MPLASNYKASSQSVSRQDTVRLKKPDQWEVLVRVVREVVDDGVLSGQKGFWWATDTFVNRSEEA